MFNLGFSELLLLGVIALIFIGPKQLPEMARTVGRLLNELKRASSDFQQTFTEPMKEDFINRIEQSRAEQSREEHSLDPGLPPDVDVGQSAHGPEAVTESKDKAADPAPTLPRGDGQHES